MSRPVLLAAYEKLAALLGKLPGSLQEPVLRELEPIKEIFLRQRPPRMAILGDTRVELPALVNAFAGRSVLHSPLLQSHWVEVKGAGLVELADLRGSGTLVGEPADLFLYIATRTGAVTDARRAADLLSMAQPREGGSPAGLAVLVIGESAEVAPVLKDLSDAGVAQSVVFSAHLSRRGLDGGFSVHEIAGFGDRLCDFVPEDAQLEMARFFRARGAQARLAGTVLRSFGAVAGVIGMNPLPLADFPILLSLQMFMVSLIIYTSGREFSLRLAGEFAASLGIGFGAGLVFRETARAAVKILPVWGHMISGGVAGAGTYALGHAAIAYYIEDKRSLRLPGKWFRRHSQPLLDR